MSWRSPKLRRSIALDPDGTPTYGSRAFNQLYLNRLDDALLTVTRATERNLESPDFRLVRYFVAFLKGDDEELRRTATAARSPRFGRPHLASGGARLARSGRLQDARRISAVPVEIAQQSGRRERAALFEAARAVWEAFYGNAAAARQSASKALALGRGRNVDYAAAFALALSGDLPQSRALAQDLAREFPEDTFVQFMYLPTLRALFALNTHDPAAAIQALQAASRYDLAYRWRRLHSTLRRLTRSTFADWPTWRPSAGRAAAEFQRILDHAASCSSIPWTRWRACSWHERSRSRATP